MKYLTNRAIISGALLLIVLLLAPTRRLPAPIHELPEQTPPPSSPANTPTTTHKPSPKPKPKATNAHVSVAKRSRFAGTWVGTMPTFPWGNIAIVLRVDSTGKTMSKSWAGQTSDSAKTQLNGDALQATFPALEGTWSVAPLPDGTTASVRLQAPFNDQTVIFQRAVE